TPRPGGGRSLDAVPRLADRRRWQKALPNLQRQAVEARSVRLLNVVEGQRTLKTAAGFTSAPKNQRFFRIAGRLAADSTAGVGSTDRSWYSQASSGVSVPTQSRDRGRRSTRKPGRDLPKPTRHRKCPARSASDRSRGALRGWPDPFGPIPHPLERGQQWSARVRV